MVKELQALLEEEEDRKVAGRTQNQPRLQILTILGRRHLQLLPALLVMDSHKVKVASDQVDGVHQTLNQPPDNNVQALVAEVMVLIAKITIVA